MHFSWQRIIPSIFFSLTDYDKIRGKIYNHCNIVAPCLLAKGTFKFYTIKFAVFCSLMLLPIIFFLSELGNQSGWLLDVDQQFLRPQSFVSLCRHNWSKRQGKDVLNITLDKISKCFTGFFLPLSHKRLMGYHHPTRQVRGQATWTPKFVNGIIREQSNLGLSNWYQLVPGVYPIFIFKYPCACVDRSF